MAPGWHPDPSGRFEFRYHNGERWTTDVSSGGVRYVDRSQPPRPRGTTAALVFGLVGLGLAWLPALFVFGLGAGVTAVVLAVRARRTVTDPSIERTLTAGLVAGTGAVALSVVGGWFTVLVYRAVERYQSPAAHDAQIAECLTEGDITRAAGTITNISGERASFTLRIDIGDDRATIETGALEPGETAPFSLRRRSVGSSNDCKLRRVDGPLPLGIDLD